MVQAGKLAGDGNGTGGYSAGRITVQSLMATFDNSYRICYNKCNDDNKKAICHQSPKFALQAAFAFMGIKSRRAAKNALQRIYLKYGNTKCPEMYAIQGQQKMAYIYI